MCIRDSLYTLSSLAKRVLILFTYEIAWTNSTCGFCPCACRFASSRSSLSISSTRISCPRGKNWLKPKIKSRRPLKIFFTRLITPSVSILFSSYIKKDKRKKCHHDASAQTHTTIKQRIENEKRLARFTSSPSSRRARSKKFWQNSSLVTQNQNQKAAQTLWQKKNSPLRFELLHDFQKLVVRLFPIFQAIFQVSQITQSVLFSRGVVHLRPAVRSYPPTRGRVIR